METDKRGGEHGLARNPTPSSSILSWEGCHNMELVLEKQRVCVPPWAPQPLGTALERWIPKASDLENQWNLFPGEPQGSREWKNPLLKGLCTGSLAQGPSSKSKSLKGIYSACKGDSYVNIKASVWEAGTSWEPGMEMQVGAILCSPALMVLVLVGATFTSAL